MSYGREPVTIVALHQPRCALRFGTAPCAATALAGKECYNTRWSCKDPSNYTGTGSITWLFTEASRNNWLPTFSEAGNDITTHPFPALKKVTTLPTRINLGYRRQGESPLGSGGTVKLTLADFPFDDRVGDYYRDTRTDPNQGTFWGKMNARNELYALMEATIYEGYEGEALADMRKRQYRVDNIAGPNANGDVTITLIDPLKLANRKKAMFPRASDLSLTADINATQTTGLSFTGNSSELLATYGNTGGNRFLRIGDEIIRYTGFSTAGGVHTLSGVIRAQWGTSGASHNADANGQRVGAYWDASIKVWDAVYDLIANHTTIDHVGLIDKPAWDAEGNTYRASLVVGGVVAEPTPVEDLIGELARDGLISFWWDEYAQQIQMRAVRPPSAEAVRIEEGRDTVGREGVQVESRPEERLTRAAVYFDQSDHAGNLDDFGNYRQAVLSVESDFEAVDLSGGDIREEIIFSRWLGSRTAAFLLAQTLLLRFARVPVYATFKIDAKDRERLPVGTLIELDCRSFVDQQGARLPRRMQVIRAHEKQPGHLVEIEAEVFLFSGRFFFVEQNDAVSYANTPELDRTLGGFLADPITGLMPNGDPPYLIQ